jgi:hypothetical protein
LKFITNIEISAKTGGKEFLQKEYNKVKADLKAGEVIFNTNLKELGLTA